MVTRQDNLRQMEIIKKENIIIVEFPPIISELEQTQRYFCEFIQERCSDDIYCIQENSFVIPLEFQDLIKLIFDNDIEGMNSYPKFLDWKSDFEYLFILDKLQRMLEEKYPNLDSFDFYEAAKFIYSVYGGISINLDLTTIKVEIPKIERCFLFYIQGDKYSPVWANQVIAFRNSNSNFAH